MKIRPKTEKLSELNAKTDRELHLLISSGLDRGLSFARLLIDEEARERWASLDEFANKAECAYALVSRLLPVAHGIAPVERRRLESRLTQLREILDCATLCTVPPMRAAAML